MGARSDQCLGIPKAWGECISNSSYKRYRAPASAGGARSTRIGHGFVRFRVERVTDASLTSDMFFQHSWRGLDGLSPSAFSEGSQALQNLP